MLTQLFVIITHNWVLSTVVVRRDVNLHSHAWANFRDLQCYCQLKFGCKNSSPNNGSTVWVDNSFKLSTRIVRLELWIRTHSSDLPLWHHCSTQDGKSATNTTKIQSCCPEPSFYVLTANALSYKPVSKRPELHGARPLQKQGRGHSFMLTTLPAARCCTLSLPRTPVCSLLTQLGLTFSPALTASFRCHPSSSSS